LICKVYTRQNHFMKKLTEQQFNEWAKRISRSDRQAFNELFRAIYPAMVHFAMRYLKDKTASKDIVQDCFISLWQTRSRIDPSRSLKNYLFTMVRNKALNAIRDRSSFNVDHDLVSDGNAGSVVIAMDDEDDGDGPSLEELMRSWINELPDRQKEALSLSRFEGFDHEEIAVVMNVSPKTVNNHIVAALRSLRERYEQYGNHSNN